MVIGVGSGDDSRETPRETETDTQADGGKAEKQVNVEKVRDMLQRHTEKNREGGEGKEESVKRRA